MTVWVGGLGWPYDELLAAALEAGGVEATVLGPLDSEAYAMGSAALPRGQCAPALFTTGALLRRAATGGEAATYLRLNTCGPCRFSLFGLGYERALRLAGLDHVGLTDVGEDPEQLERLAPGLGTRAVDALLVADALAERLRRARLGAPSPSELQARAEALGRELATRIAEGEPPLSTLEAVRALGPTPPTPADAPRVALVGEPFSLHVEGLPQLMLPELLADAGCVTLAPPAALWLAYRLWALRQPPFGSASRPDASRRARAAQLEAGLRTRYEYAMRMAGLEDHPLPDVDELTELARPHLPPDWRAGYGHVEVGLALHAVGRRGADLVISLKSFGCMPSSSVVDAILPPALEGEAPFLALEVCADGEAARESRLRLALGAARRRARRRSREARATPG